MRDVSPHRLTLYAVSTAQRVGKYAKMRRAEGKYGERDGEREKRGYREPWAFAFGICA